MTEFLLIASGILGAIFGSFASAIIPRIREKRDFVSERSKCPECKHPLGVFDLFPIISFLFLRGKCRYCGKRIPKFHFILEVTMMSGFLLVSMFLVDAWLLFTGDMWEWGRYVFLLVAMFISVVFCAYDLMYMEIPDELLLPFLICTFFLLSWSEFLPQGTFWHFIPFLNEAFNSPLIQAMLGAIPIFLFFLALILGSSGRWMWGGDLRVALFMGFVWWAKIVWLWLFLSYIVGSIVGIAALIIYRQRNMMIPFWPFLAIGLWSAILWYEPIIKWYMNLSIN